MRLNATNHTPDQIRPIREAHDLPETNTAVRKGPVSGARPSQKVSAAGAASGLAPEDDGPMVVLCYIRRMAGSVSKDRLATLKSMSSASFSPRAEARRPRFLRTSLLSLPWISVLFSRRLRELREERRRAQSLSCFFWSAISLARTREIAFHDQRGPEKRHRCKLLASFEAGLSGLRAGPVCECSAQPPHEELMNRSGWSATLYGQTGLHETWNPLGPSRKN